MTGPPRPGPPNPPPPNPNRARPGPPNPCFGPGTDVVVVEVEAVAAASGVPPDAVAAWASAVAPTATPAAAPMPTATFSQRRRGRPGRSGVGPQGAWAPGGVPGMSCIVQPLRLASAGGPFLRTTVRLDSVATLWISLFFPGQGHKRARPQAGPSGPDRRPLGPAPRPAMQEGVKETGRRAVPTLSVR